MLNSLERNYLKEKYMGKAIYITSSVDDKTYCKSNGQFTRHLRDFNLTYQEYYERYVTGVERKCSCGSPMTFYQSSETYAESCGNPVCVGKLISVTKKSWSDEQKAQDSLNKSLAQTDAVKETRKAKMIKTNRERYGVDFTTQSTSMQAKSKVTKKERYGDEYYSNPALTSQTWQAKTTESLEALAEKKRDTCLARYGVTNTFLIPDVKRKSALSNSKGKEFIMPSGKVVRVRGYEDIALPVLLQTYQESDLVIHDSLVDYVLPVFSYVNVNEHRMSYYPDIYIPKENKIIEVKGRWWWDGNGRTDEKYTSRLTNNLKKRKAVIDAGYQYEVWLFEDRNTYRILKDDRDFNKK